ncbi:MAG: ABC transporter ATP-binding protein [Chloroflexi bacterium 44-23]|nr:MAG: ABC transporter ATP-binding protein [Chloroflexi bacterium 44-23]
MKKTSENFAYYTVLNMDHEQAVEKVTAALKEEGFGVLTNIDMQATLKQKLDVDFRKYAILGACNPPLAHQSLKTQLNIGLLLPCNVIVYEEDNGSVVEILDPIKMMKVAENPDLEPVAQDAQSRLQRVIKTLKNE